MLHHTYCITEPVLRVPVNDPALIKKALDCMRLPGGVLIPMVETPAEAEAAVAACRYPPAGVRGVAFPLVRATGWGTQSKGPEDYLRQCEEELFIIVQVESAAAVDKIESIAAVPGVDCVFIGPFDLSASIGRPGQLEHPEVVALVAKAEDGVLKVQQSSGGRPVLGGFCPPSRPLIEMYNRGYQFVCGGADMGILREAAKKDVASAQEAMTTAMP
jgi:2-keto-3-deoxy-L-rhamnonate aldolase RhmA